MSSIISIPVSPLIMSLFNECKENLKYADKSNTDFLIFLLNSSMHIFSIVKEFAPILQDAVGSTCPTENNTSQLEELEKKSNGFLSPSKAPSSFNTSHDEETTANGLGESDDEISINSLDSPETSPSQNLISESVISDHFANYSKPSNMVSSSTPKKSAFSCPKCSASFSFKQALHRHISKNSCDYHLHGRKRKLSLLNKHSNSTVGDTKKKKSYHAEENGFVSDEESAEMTSPGYNGTELLCPDCGKAFLTTQNLNRHIKLSRSCGSTELLELEDFSNSTNLPNETDDEISETTFECSFCKSVLGSRKSFDVHKRKFRCKRHCKFCEYTAYKSASVQAHLKKEHNSLLSIEEIEEHNRELYSKHVDELLKAKMGQDPAKQDLPQLGCPVFRCTFSTIHKNGQSNHIKHHKAELANSGEDLSNCETCDMIGIPKNVLSSHNCLNKASDIEIDSQGTDKENGDHTNESMADKNLIAEESESPTNISPKKKVALSPPKKKVSLSPPKKTVSLSPPKKKVSLSPPKRKVSLGLKRSNKSKSASIAMPPLLKMATNSSSPEKKSKLTLKKKIMNKSADSSYVKCKLCDFVGASNKHLAGHMNVHKRAAKSTL